MAKAKNPLEIIITRETITPEFLEAHGLRLDGNRTFRPSLCCKYGDAIRNGEWVVNAEAIKITEDGRVIDGQHRIMAVIETGTPITCYVAWNVPPEAIHTVDTGKKRTVGDIFDVLTGRRLPRSYTPVFRNVIAHRSGRTRKPRWNSDAPNPYECRDLLADCPWVVTAVEEAESFVKRMSKEPARWTASKPMIMFCHWALTSEGNPKEAVETYLSEIILGGPLRERGGSKEALRGLARRAEKRADGKAKYRTWPEGWAFIIITGWNRWVNAFRGFSNSKAAIKPPTDQPPLPSIEILDKEEF